MSNRDGRFLIVLGAASAVVLFAALAASGENLSQGSGRQEAAADSAQAEQSNATSARGTPLVRQTVSEEKLPKSKADKNEVELGSWPDWVIVVFTLVLTVVAILQHRLEGKISRDTIDALNIARASADAAKKGADATVSAARASRRLVGATTALAQAASAQVRIAETNSRKQLQAYVHAEDLTFQWTPEGYPLFSIKLANTGQTPAVRVRAGGRAFFGSAEVLALEDHVGDLLLGRMGVVGANSTYTASLIVDGFKLIRREQISTQNMLGIFGRITYEDVFGKEYATEFGFFTTNALGQTLVLTGKFLLFSETR